MQAASTQDLRSNARDHGRVKAQTAKWARGGRPQCGTSCIHADFVPCEGCVKRPNRLEGRNYTALKQVWHKKEVAKNTSSNKQVLRKVVVEAVDDVHDGLSDSSGDFDIDETSTAPELKEIMYSFDAPTGPSRGGNILSVAITQAVQRFENNETEKIVKNEYDLVLDGKDEPESYVADADDDFEFIDDSHLK